MNTYEIPDPFAEFVKKKYKNFAGMVYDFFGQEWKFTCLTCKEKLYAPTRKTMIETRLYHTRNICLGGY